MPLPRTPSIKSQYKRKKIVAAVIRSVKKISQVKPQQQVMPTCALTFVFLIVLCACPPNRRVVVAQLSMLACICRFSNER
mmetsp:Transcript_15762/g.32368  ORF Transcript_15762/g.32368 Transcript_15762/m.32368 type:complete len:80 (+) Transcript_15762:983-1222(+)